MKPSEALAAAEVAIQAGEVVMFWGTWGSGKSDGVYQVSQRLNRKLYEVRTSLIDSVDLRGCPSVSRNGGGQLMTEWGYPSMFPTQPGSLIFFDEINCGLPQIQAACYQIILNKAVGEHRLPENTAMICAGNREGDGGVTHKMPAPLANRIVHIDWELDLQDWVNWALANGVRTDVIAFLRFRPNLLHQVWIDQSSPTKGPRPSLDGAKKAQPSPRTWTKLSRLVDACENGGVSGAVEYGLINGAVGEGPGTEYLAFRRIARTLVSPDQIILDPNGAPVPDQSAPDGPAALYAVVTSLAPKASDKTIERIMVYTDRLPADYQVVLVRDMMAVDRNLINSRPMIEWAAKNHDVVI